MKNHSYQTGFIKGIRMIYNAYYDDEEISAILTDFDQILVAKNHVSGRSISQKVILKNTYFASYKIIRAGNKLLFFSWSTVSVLVLDIFSLQLEKHDMTDYPNDFCPKYIELIGDRIWFCNDINERRDASFDILESNYSFHTIILEARHVINDSMPLVYGTVNGLKIYRPIYEKGKICIIDTVHMISKVITVDVSDYVMNIKKWDDRYIITDYSGEIIITDLKFFPLWRTSNNFGEENIITNILVSKNSVYLLPHRGRHWKHICEIDGTFICDDFLLPDFYKPFNTFENHKRSWALEIYDSKDAIIIPGFTAVCSLKIDKRTSQCSAFVPAFFSKYCSYVFKNGIVLDRESLRDYLSYLGEM